MNKYLLSLLFLALLISSACQNTKKAEKDDDTVTAQTDTLALDTASEAPHIRNVVEKFIEAYNAKDNQAVNALIHPEYGLIVVHRPGALDWFEKVPGIDFKNPIPSYYDYVSASHTYNLQFGSLPVYACETESWDKAGLFVDTLTQTNVIMPIADQLSEFEDVELDPNYRTDVRVAEDDSHRVILTTEVPLVFHVKKIDGQWYVTVLDRAYGDCSA